MKKFLLLFAFFITIPSLALCPIADGESVCSIQNNNSSTMPLFQNSSTGMSMDNSQKQIPKQDKTDSFGKTANQTGIQMQGSLGCQFGNCNKGGNNDFLRNE